MKIKTKQPDEFAMDREDSAREYDINGWYEIDANPISRVGVFPYLGKNIKGAPDPGAFYNVYRPASELSDPACIESFRLVPWVDDHAMLGKGDKLTLPEDKGIHGVIGERVFFDESDQTLKGNIKVFTSSHADTIDAGKRELSAGYRCIYTQESGVFEGVRYDYVQRKMRGNHLASVNDGRMGPDISVMDAKETFSFTIDSKEFKSMVIKANKGPKAKPKAKPVNKVTELFGKLMAYATDAAEEGEEKDAGEMAELAALLEQAEPLIEQIASIGAVQSGAATPDDEVTDITPVTDALPVGAPATAKATDAEEGKEKDKGAVAMDAKEVKKLVAAAVAEALAGVSHGMDAKDVFREVKARDTLAEDLSFHVGAFDHSEMTHAEVAAYGVKKLAIPNVPEGQEVGALSAYLHGRSRPRAPAAQHAMDGAEKGTSFVSNYVNGKE